MIFSLFDMPAGADPLPGNRIVYDVGRGEAWAGSVGVQEHALVWELSEYGAEGALLSAEVALKPEDEWLMRCDRVDFPPGGVAYLHTHPGPPIRLISCRHEAGAANMAEAYGKLTGRPGICLVTRGPGATHASVGIHNAWQDSTPMILLVGQVPRRLLGRDAFQEMDLGAVFG